MRGTSLVIVLASLSVAGAAWAGVDGDAFRGKIYSEGECASCHGVEADATSSPDPVAPPFRDFDVRQTTGTEFAKWINGDNHPLIPNTILKDNQAADILAYILSMKSSNANE